MRDAVSFSRVHRDFSHIAVTRVKLEEMSRDSSSARNSMPCHAAEVTRINLRGGEQGHSGKGSEGIWKITRPRSPRVPLDFPRGDTDKCTDLNAKDTTKSK